jgi:succinate dehydrogenase/fumarate reductase cytochrome b subunit
VPTTASCDTCHRTTGWIPATFSHTGVTPGSCATCHNGSSAKGKPATHIVTTASCDTCHRTTAWIPATFSHTGVTPGSCATCHNGSSAKGKPATHVPTTLACDSCHRTTAWIPATFSHTSVTPGSCANCHNGSTAKGKPSGHFVTTQACDACHRTTAWTPVSAYSHKSAFYKAHNAGVTCTSCHTTSNEVIAWKFAAYKPDCAGCHAGSFKPDAHTKVSSPKLLYTVAELKDCSGACHQYTNSSMTTVSKSRTGQHRPTSGGF